MMKPIVFILLIVFIGSCDKTEDPINRINKKLKISSTGILRKDIPEFYNDTTSSWHFAQNIRNNFGLPSIENGSEAFEIRIMEELEGGRMLLRIRFQDSTWIAENYIYRPFYIYTDDNTLTIDSVVVNYINLGPPKSRWNKLINELIDKGILDFKDETTFSGYGDVMDMPLIQVEIAAKNYYKYYSLPDDKTTFRISDDAKSLAKIIDLIRIEFPEIKSQINKFKNESNASN